MQQELDLTTQRSAAQEHSLQNRLDHSHQEREQLQFELKQTRSAVESNASEREYMQSETSSLQQALHQQAREAQQAQQAVDSWMTRYQDQVTPAVALRHRERTRQYWVNPEQCILCIQINHMLQIGPTLIV